MKDPFVAGVGRTIAADRMIRTGRDSVLVAVSGGPDSMALLAALHDLGRGRLRLAVAHVNHHLRGGSSDRDERFVVKAASSLGLECICLDGRVAEGPNLEERARLRRYELLVEAARRGRFHRIATGHTLDDQAETILFRLVRGAGGTGLGGIAPVRADGVIRPLLERRRAEVLAFLSRRGIPCRTDTTNRNPRFARNRIRRRVLPLLERELNPDVRGALCRTATLLRDDEDLLEALALRAFRRARSAGGLSADRLSGLRPALQRRVIRLWLGERRGSLRRIGIEHVEAVRRLAGKASGRTSLPGGVVVRSGRLLRWGETARPVEPVDRILLRDEVVSVPGWIVRVRRRKTPDGLRPGRWRAVFDAAALEGGPLHVRRPRPGDRIRPLGLGGSRKLQDVFVDAKTPREQRSRWIVVEDESGVLWVPGLVRSERGRLGRSSREVVVLEASRR